MNQANQTFEMQDHRHTYSIVDDRRDHVEYPNEETRRAIEEIERGEGLSRRFHTVDELMKDLLSDA